MAEQAGDNALARKASNNLGVLAYSSGDYQQAQRQFNAAPSQQSTTASTYLNLIGKQQQASEVNKFIAEGVSLRRRGLFESAINAYDQALAIEANNVRALEYKGYALFRLGKNQQTEQVLNLALEQDPNRINSLINLMKSLCSQHNQNGLDQLKARFNQQLLSQQQTLQQDGELKQVCGEAFLANL